MTHRVGRKTLVGRRVVIVQRVVPNYRLAFFNGLRKELSSRGIELDLLVGNQDRIGGGANTPPAWATRTRIRSLSIAGTRLDYQSVIRRSWNADLVIAEQASKSAHTALQIALQKLKCPRVALWGHGINLHTDQQNSAAEKFKRVLTARSHWFFAYTPGTAQLVTDSGYDPDRVTTIRNTIDIGPLVDAVAEAALTAPRSPKNVIALGRLYDLKRPEFLIDVARELHRMDPAITVTVVGDGPLSPVVANAAKLHDWLEHVTDVEGLAVAPWLSRASLMLAPGMVGLSVVDAIASGLPTLATEGRHSPEFEYLEDGVTGRVVTAESTAQQYAAEAHRLLESTAELKRMQENCRTAAEALQMEQMVSDFAAGIENALVAERRRAPVKLTLRVDSPPGPGLTQGSPR